MSKALAKVYSSFAGVAGTWKSLKRGGPIAISPTLASWQCFGSNGAVTGNACQGSISRNVLRVHSSMA